ncbi:L,D-transpeptidase family protein [Patescibacteria group bacterium]|nr:L,D-transpeptidase family protein [Patescibacteria group bacterium]
MLNKTLIKYVKTSREKGVREYFIRQALLDAGWKREEVDDILDSEEGWPSKARVDFMGKVGNSFEKIKKKSGEHKEGLRRPIIGWILIGLLLISGLIAWRVLKHYNPSYEIPLPSNIQEDLSSKFGSWPALEDAQFFKQVKASFINNDSSFIEGDLSDMKLRVYRNGKLATEVDILSKGNEGSWWETPAGLYEVQSKEADHFSSFGKVHMPWSMAFQGNFFIHGWPYYPDGTPVPKGYSGGCIRLSDKDAKEVYDLASPGMPVLVFEKDFEEDEFKYDFIGGQIDANNFLGADLKNNFVFAEKGSKEQVPIASLTKLMTALVATEYINIEHEVVITSNALVPTSKPRLQTGQRVSVLDLLYPLLMESSNEAGVAIGQILGMDRFVELMNEKAKAIGMKNTTFVDTTDADHENTSTAQDLFQLAKYLYNNRSFVLAISSGVINKSAYDPPPWKDLENFNVFENDPDFVGGKVGENNAAKETLLAVFEIEKTGVQRPIVAIILGSDDRATDASALINYIRGGR